VVSWSGGQVVSKSQLTFGEKKLKLRQESSWSEAKDLTIQTTRHIKSIKQKTKYEKFRFPL
jgi:hypothetical protein